MTGRYDNTQIRAKYETLAPRYDRIDAPQEWLGVRRLRRRLLSQARGEVLEVAAGTGKNFAHYPPGCRISAVDLSPAMLDVARAAQLGLNVDFSTMSADALAFPSARFDTVVSTLSTCTFPDPLAALREMARVCKPDGHILLLEHGRSSREWLGRLQDRRAERHAERAGCY
jgi:ubiquinone/menaquinone biosynthesis C-methylase UbiE